MHVSSQFAFFPRAGIRAGSGTMKVHFSRMLFASWRWKQQFWVARHAGLSHSFAKDTAHVGARWSFCDVSRQTGLVKAVIHAQAGDSLLSSSFSGEFPSSLFLPCSLCSRRMSKAFPAHSCCCWAPSSCPPLERWCCFLDVFSTPMSQLCRELFSCWNTQRKNALYHTFHPSDILHPFKGLK